ncbi:MAG: hypothetical protein VKN33_01505 [Candidatus Sericytochromatia bacterium]|nr:hypothetical protein [Candidatus Sericytochromatia bacterium]
MSDAPLSVPNITTWLGWMALVTPLVLLLVVYDVRWIALSVRAGRRPPWGTWVRLAAAALCHGGALLLVLRGSTWPASVTVWWMHMLLDPGLSLYAVGLWELQRRAVLGARVRKLPL